MSPVSIQHRLSRRLVVGIAALLVLFGAGLGGILVREISKEFDRSLESKAHALMNLAQPPGPRTGESDNFVREPRDGRRATFFVIRSADRSLDEQSREAPGVSTGSGSISASRFSNVTLSDGVAGRQVEIDFLLPGTTQWFTVMVAEPRATLYWKALKASLTLLGFCALLLAALSLLVRHSLRRGLEPVVGLRRQLEILDPEHRGQRVNLQAPPAELAPILRRINDLLRRAETPLPGRRRAAH